LYDSKIWIFGGTDNDSVLNELYVYDLTHNSFQKITQAEEVGIKAPMAHGHTATLYHKAGENPKMLIFGGGYWKEDQRCYMNQIYSYDLLDNHWAILEASGDIPPGRSFHSTCLYEDRLIIFGGWWMTGDGRSRKEFYTNDLLEFDLSTYHWKKHRATPNTPDPRNRHSWVKFTNDSFLVYGGNYYNQKNRQGYFYNDLYFVRVNQQGNDLFFDWHEIKTTNTPLLSHHHAFFHDQKLVLGMGEVKTHKLHQMYNLLLTFE